MIEPMIEIVRPGPLATVQDLGRPGLAHLGVPHGGAADTVSLGLANRLVGNPENAAGLEVTLGGLTARFGSPAWLALSGAPVPARIDARMVGMNAPCHIRAGQRLEVGTPSRGVRTYLAVRGGIDVPPVLGSRSADLLSGLGPARLSAGAVLPVGDTARCAEMSVDQGVGLDLSDEPCLRVLAGPRDDWFAADALATLTAARYAVTAESNRVGVRLEGPRLARSRDDELSSEGMVTGALQVPPNGQPILFLVDHPPTGGYPVIAVVAAADVPLAAQLRPGTPVRFRAVERMDYSAPWNRAVSS